MAISNLRQTRGRVETLGSRGGDDLLQTSIHRGRSKKIEHRVFVMLYVQVTLLAVFTLPLAIQKLYATLTMAMMK